MIWKDLRACATTLGFLVSFCVLCPGRQRLRFTHRSLLRTYVDEDCSIAAAVRREEKLGDHVVGYVALEEVRRLDVWREQRAEAARLALVGREEERPGRRLSVVLLLVEQELAVGRAAGLAREEFGRGRDVGGGGEGLGDLGRSDGLWGRTGEGGAGGEEGRDDGELEEHLE